MRKLIILFLCCGGLVSMVGCGGNTASPPTESLPTTVSETVIKEIPPITAVEPPEKEKEPVPIESKEQVTEDTVSTPITTKKPTEETKKLEHLIHQRKKIILKQYQVQHHNLRKAQRQNPNH